MSCYSFYADMFQFTGKDKHAIVPTALKGIILFRSLISFFIDIIDWERLGSWTGPSNGWVGRLDVQGVPWYACPIKKAQIAAKPRLAKRGVKMKYDVSTWVSEGCLIFVYFWHLHRPPQLQSLRVWLRTSWGFGPWGQHFSFSSRYLGQVHWQRQWTALRVL